MTSTWGSYDTICVAPHECRRRPGPRVPSRRSRGAGGWRAPFVVRRARVRRPVLLHAGCCDGGVQRLPGEGRPLHEPDRARSPTTRVSPLMASTSKGGIVAGATGNRRIGPGHNGLVIPPVRPGLAAVPRDPDGQPRPLARSAGGTLRLTRRPMLIDLGRTGSTAGRGCVPAPARPKGLKAVFRSLRVRSPLTGNGFAPGCEPVRGWSLAEELDVGTLRHRGGEQGHRPTSSPTHDAPSELRAEADLGGSPRVRPA